MSETQQQKKTWWVKFNQDNGKVIRISPRELKNNNKDHNVIQSDNLELCTKIMRGQMSIKKVGVTWDVDEKKWFLDEKKESLVLKQLTTRIYRIEENNPLHSDLHLFFYKDTKILELSVDVKNIKHHMNLNDITTIANTEHTLLNLYFTRKDDPDQLIKSLDIDSELLFKERKLRFDISNIVKYIDWSNIDIYTRQVFKKYSLETLETDYIEGVETNQKNILQKATLNDDLHRHLHIYASGSKVKITHNISDSHKYILKNESTLQFVVCNNTIDKFIGGFQVSIEKLFKSGSYTQYVDFDFPEKPLIIYKNNNLSVKFQGGNNEFN
jgi:hypothetical protein